jgi:hypothetical protein
MITVERKTPYISDETDTIAFMKCFMHNRTKRKVFEETQYDELPKIISITEAFKENNFNLKSVH